MSKRGYNLGPIILLLIIGYIIAACTSIYVTGDNNKVEQVVNKQLDVATDVKKGTK